MALKIFRMNGRTGREREISESPPQNTDFHKKKLDGPYSKKT